MKKIIYILFLLVLLSGCINWLIEPEPKMDGKIKIVNNSNRFLVFCPLMKYQSNNGDTILNPNRDIVSDYNDPEYLISPDSNKVYEFNVKTEKRILDKDVIMYYLFDLDTLNKYSWEEIATGYKVLKRVDFDTWEDMENCNFTITYP